MREAGTDVATIGQYLRPTRRNLAVAEYVTPAQFERYRELRPLDRLQDGVQRSAGAQFLHGGRGQRASPVRLNLLLALASALLLILAFPAFDIAVLAPFALAPLLVAMAREPGAKRRFLLGWAAGILYWVGVCYWIEYVLAMHGGMAPWAAWLAFALFSLAKALHMGVFALLAGPLLARRWALADGAGPVGRDRTHTRRSRLRLARARAMRAWICRCRRAWPLTPGSTGSRSCSR